MRVPHQKNCSQDQRWTTVKITSQPHGDIHILLQTHAKLSAMRGSIPGTSDQLQAETDQLHDDHHHEPNHFVIFVVLNVVVAGVAALAYWLAQR